MTNPNHTDTSRSGELVERLRKARVWPDYSQSRVTIETAHEAADRIEAQAAEIERLKDQLSVESEPSPYCPVCGSCGDEGCCGSKRCMYPDTGLEALEAEIEQLRGVLEAVWKEGTTMRNASKLVGPYPKEPANNRVWARSMYRAGRKLHALVKPVRATLGEKQ